MSATTATVDPLVERRSRYHEADVVVVGAGVFGCAAAYALANQGRSVILLERWMKEPNRIVGELMQPGGVEALRKLGLGDTIERLQESVVALNSVVGPLSDLVGRIPGNRSKGKRPMRGSEIYTQIDQDPH